MFAVSKSADLNQLLQGGKLYWAFPFSKGSLILVIRVSPSQKQPSPQHDKQYKGPRVLSESKEP
jgi:hypothetical protein